MSEWIDVRDRLPDRLDVYSVTVYNVFVDRSFVTTARFEPTTNEWVRREKSGIITAWKERDKPYERKVGKE